MMREREKCERSRERTIRVENNYINEHVQRNYYMMIYNF